MVTFVYKPDTILVQLLSDWMDPNRPLYPPKRHLLQRIRISESTLKKHIQELESAGFIRREQQYTDAGDFGSNIYHMDGLVTRLKTLAPDFDRERAERNESHQRTESPNARRNKMRGQG